MMGGIPTLSTGNASANQYGGSVNQKPPSTANTFAKPAPMSSSTDQYGSSNTQ